VSAAFVATVGQQHVREVDEHIGAYWILEHIGVSNV